MVRIEQRKIKKCRLEDLTLTFLEDYFADYDKRQDIFIVYDNNNLKTLFSYDDFRNIKSEWQLRFYLLNSNNSCFVGKIENADKIFKRFPMWNYLAVSIGEETGEFIVRIRYGKKINDIYAKLKSAGVNAYRVKIPVISDIHNEDCYGKDRKYGLYEFMHFIVDGGLQAPQYTDKVTDIRIGTETRIAKLHGRQLGNAKRKIYLVGPCIVGGWSTPEQESLPEILFEKIMQSGYEYSVLPISQQVSVETEPDLILTYDIKRNDIVIFISQALDCDYELDTTPLYNSYKGSKWLFHAQVPIHTTVTGNRLIADFLMEKIVQPAFSGSSDTEDDTLVYESEPQFSYEMQENISRYIETIRETRIVPHDTDIGAIVMNCNPFTYGHRYLVEYAVKQVDYLYLFVVEEDLSAVPFAERFFMVQEGVKDFNNVIVVPSGHFIISQDTFKNYFEKETDIHDVSVEEDVYIFARYISKGLNISKRFVGEEPKDYVTNTYNQTMKKIFGKYNIELIEIPRSELGEGGDYQRNRGTETFVKR